MNRGIYKEVANAQFYAESEKDWHVELLRSDCFWYDLIVNPPGGFESNRAISEYLKKLKESLEQGIDKRFIYYIAARKKVRFSLRKSAKYSKLSDEFIFYVEVGRERAQKKLKTKIFDNRSKKHIKPDFEITEKFITFISSEEDKVTYSIHDFLNHAGILLGINTEVHYVGFTNNPSQRPINRQHRGLADILYSVPNDQFDFFVFYHLFKVLSISHGRENQVGFCIANSMIDEISADDEGKIIEKALILYFDTVPQELNKKNEITEMKNQLNVLTKKYRINSVSFDLETETLSEYSKFFSREVSPSLKHVFTFNINNGNIDLQNGSKLLDMLSDE